MTNKPSKVMLASPAETISDFIFPLLASPKLDGIRCLTIRSNGIPDAVSRKLKSIPNFYIRDQIKKYCPIGLDGEIIIPDVDFNETSSVVMSFGKISKFEYHVFDYIPDWDDLSEDFSLRISRLKNLENIPNFIKIVPQILLKNKDELEQYEIECLSNGYEGVMTRKLSGKYKEGRSTLKEQLLLKLKRFKQDEASVIGITEFMHNSNEGVRDHVGYLKRSTHQENMIGMGTMGALVCVNGTSISDEDTSWFFENRNDIDNALLKSSKYFKIGTGFTMDLRKEIWNDKNIKGKIATYKHQESGAKAGGKPRFPVFKGFRHKDDM